MDLTEGSETSAKLNLTPGKYPKENIQVYALCLFLQILFVAALDIKTRDVHTVTSINSLLSQYFMYGGGGGGTGIWGEVVPRKNARRGEAPKF
jgi:hypothetical protein